MPLQAVRETNLEASKLDQLAGVCGLSIPEFTEEFFLSDVVPGICMNPDCSAMEEVEPDEREGWCGDCGMRSITSGLILAGLI